jgi:hypothetical protein
MKNIIREVSVDGQVAHVALTLGYHAIIDAEDAQVVGKFNWRALVKKRKDGGIRCVYAVSSCRDENAKGKTIYLHRIIVCPNDEMHVDHVNGDGLDNRRSNLRAATPSQNRMNQKVRRDSKSGVKGVYFDARRRVWTASIKVNGKKFSLGSFALASDAAQAYASASLRLHGEFGAQR